MVDVMRTRLSLLLALLCLALAGCDAKEPTVSDLVGTWTVTDESRAVLPTELRQARGKLSLSGTGEFTSDGVPGEMLYTMPGMAHMPTISGAGTWKLGRVDGNLALLLTFRAINGPTQLKVPNGTQLLIDSGRHKITLYFFLGDPDEGKRVDFTR